MAPDLDVLNAQVAHLRERMDLLDRVYAERDKARQDAAAKVESTQHAYNALHNDLQRKMELQSKEMVSRAEFDARLAAMNDRVQEMRASVLTHHASSSGQQASSDLIKVNVALLISFVSILIVIVKELSR